MSDDAEPLDDAERERRWLAERRAPVGSFVTTLTATDAGKVYGVHKKEGPIDVWLEKTGQTTPQPRTEQQESGHRMQKPILTWYADREKCPIVFADPYHFARSQVLPLVGASLDATRTDVIRPVDAKNIGYPQRGEWGDAYTDQMPLQYAVQLCVQMFVTVGAESADLAVLVRGQQLVIYRLRRDAQFEQDLIGRLVEFHDKYVKPVEPPPVDASEGWTTYIKQKFATHTAQIIKATPELTTVAEEFCSLRAQMKAMKLRQTLLGNTLRLAIGKVRGIDGGEDWSATFNKAADGSKIDYETATQLMALRFAEETGKPFGPVLAEVIAKATKPTTGSRRLLVNWKGEDGEE